MFASTQDLEFVQGQSRDVPDRELVLIIYVSTVQEDLCKVFFQTFPKYGPGCKPFSKFYRIVPKVRIHIRSESKEILPIYV